jgi:hypothetical protein
MLDVGAGVVLQGSGADALVSHCAILAEPHGAGNAPCVGCEHGGEAYRLDGSGLSVDPAEPTNGHVVVEDSVLLSLSAGPIIYARACESFTLRRCVLMGPPGAYLDVRDCGTTDIEAHTINLPEQVARVPSWLWPSNAQLGPVAL